MSKGLRIGSMNVSGLRSDAFKRRDVFNWVKKKCIDVMVMQETHCSTQDENKWLGEWGYKGFFSNYDTKSRGVGILFNNSFEYKMHNVVKDSNGRFIMLDLTIFNTRFTLAGVYGPNMDSPDFFINLQRHIEQIGNTTVIIVGDWNVVLDYKIDTKGLVRQNNPKSQAQINTLCQDLDLFDIWRLKNPKKSSFTWHSRSKPIKQSRLDYFLVSSDIGDICHKTSITPGYRTDHSMISIEIRFTQQKSGRGLWRFNNSILRDIEYVNEVKQCIRKTLSQYKTKNPETADNMFTINDQLLFETLKLEIRGITIPYCATKKRKREEREKELEIQLTKLKTELDESASDDKQTEYEIRQNELILCRKNKIEGIIVRSKAKWYLEGEKNSKYFCNLEKRHYTEKLMTKIIVEDDKEIEDLDTIIKEQKKFYESLYTSRKPKKSKQFEKTFFPKERDHIPKVSVEEKARCEGKITEQECLQFLKNMKNNKTPGSDGYTAEFYKFFWKDLRTYLVRSINYGYTSEKLSVTQRLGVLNCLPKPHKSKYLLKNWRPISLLNIDYKIATGVIANRMKPTLQNIIGDQQKGFLKGRNIGECIRTIYDALSEAENRRMVGMILLIDFEKAFDSIEWDFMDQVLEYFGYGESLRKWVKVFYTDVESCIINNGHCSERFKIARGVRQGDPLSPYLFLLCVEVLALAIKTDPDIKGWSFDDTEYLIAQYADDTTLLLDGSEESFEKSISILELFSKFSGLKVNCEKTKIIWVGATRLKQFMKEHDFHWQLGGKFTLLGITFDLSRDDWTKCNFEEKIQQFRTVLNSWVLRDLTLIGKITVIKSLALPKLVMLFQVLPSPKEDLLKEIERICFNFIWGGKKDKIKRTCMINSIESGGLNMICIRSFCHAQKITWVKKLLDIHNQSDWKKLFESKMEALGGNYIWNCTDVELQKVKKRLNTFWIHVLEAWSKYGKTFTNEVNENNVLQQTLFLNTKIKMQNQPIFLKQWFLAGVRFVNDIINEEGRIMTHREFCRTYNVAADFLTYNAVMYAIPNEWKQIASNYGKKVPEAIPEHVTRIQNIKKASKFAYEILRKHIATRNIKSEEKWAVKININAEEGFWNNAYLMAKSCTAEVKLRIFQHKILTRILATNKFLFRCNLIETQLCTFCGIYTETIEHLFYECNITRSIWLQLKDWLFTFGIDLELDPAIIVFGRHPLSRNRLINHLILITKYNVYRCKLQLKEPNFALLKQDIKFYYRIESTYGDIIQIQKSNTKWAPLIQFVSQ